MSVSAISTDSLTKTYGKGDSLFRALQDITLDIKQGESVAIIGKSGSGKSTLMHLLALMDEPTAGAVLIGSQNASTMPKRKLDMLRNETFGFVFQQFFLNANASALDNVMFASKKSPGIGNRERKRRGLEALQAVELVAKAGNKAKDLSGGQKQRVVIARALINDPQIIFADEPTGNLDSNTGAIIEQLLFKLIKRKALP